MGEASSIRGPSDYVHFRPNSPTRVIRNPGDLGAFIESRGASGPPREERSCAWPSPAGTLGRVRVLACHSPHQRCGVREYGIALDESFSKIAETRSCTTSDVDSAAGVLGPGDVLLMHFEPSIMSNGLRGALESACARGVKVVFCCHYFDRQSFDRWEPLAHRFVVHRSYGFSHPKIVEIPLGCPIYEPEASRADLRARWGLPKDRVVLTTVGFLSAWKKIPELVEALLAYAPSQPRLFINVQAPRPFFEQPQSSEESRLHAQMARFPSGYARCSTDFLGQRDLLDMVHASDVGFVFHGTHTGSVSAATKQFVSARTPVVVTSSSHAADLRAGVERVDSLDPHAFAGRVVHVATQTVMQAKMREEMQAEYDRINMDVVALQYLDLFRNL